MTKCRHPSLRRVCGPGVHTSETHLGPQTSLATETSRGASWGEGSLEWVVRRENDDQLWPWDWQQGWGLSVTPLKGPLECWRSFFSKRTVSKRHKGWAVVTREVLPRPLPVDVLVAENAVSTASSFLPLLGLGQLRSSQATRTPQLTSTGAWGPGPLPNSRPLFIMHSFPYHWSLEFPLDAVVFLALFALVISFSQACIFC